MEAARPWRRAVRSRWNGVEACAEKMRQAQERRIAIELDIVVFRSNQQVHAGQGLE
jgi:hypothetical protein